MVSARQFTERLGRHLKETYGGKIVIFSEGNRLAVHYSGGRSSYVQHPHDIEPSTLTASELFDAATAYHFVAEKNKISYVCQGTLRGIDNASKSRSSEYMALEPDLMAESA